MSEIAVAEPGTRLQNFLDRAGLRGFPWKTATILYTISWGWLFIVRDSYWADDWNRFLHPEITPFDYDSLGLAPWTALNFVFFKIFGPGLFRLITFCFYFGSGVAVFGIIKSIEYLNLMQRKQILLMFLLLPFGSARVTLMVFHYTTAYFAFFLAWFLFVSFPTRSSRCMYVPLFFFSFQMHSLVFFILLPILLAAIKSKINNILKLRGFIKDNLILICLPFFYLGLRNIFWKGWTTYHTISKDGFIQFAKIVLVCLFVLIVISFASKFRSFPKKVLAIGMATSMLALTPYILGGFYVSSDFFVVTFLEWMLGRSDWDARHQILQPFGAAFLIVGVSCVMPMNRKFKQIVFSLILTLSVIFNFGFGFEYVVDYQKQRAIADAIAVSDHSQVITELQIIDNTKHLNARGRTYRPRDWLGITSLAINLKQVLEIKNVDYKCREVGGTRFLLIRGPETHWQALKNWVSDGDMGFKVTVDDTPGACKPGMSTSEPEEINNSFSGAIPILFYFTGAKG